MDFLDVIAKRHSVRKYTEEPLDRELIDRIIDIAETAPSSRNCKSSAFMVVDDPDTLRALSEMRTSGAQPLAGAAAAIIVMGDETLTDMWVENASISATFIQLAATALDLGSCWIQVRGRDRDKSDSSKGTAEQYLRDLLGIREGMRILCIVSLGHPEVI